MTRWLPCSSRGCTAATFTGSRLVSWRCHRHDGSGFAKQGTRVWSDEDRAEQAEMIQSDRPWEKSTRHR